MEENSIKMAEEDQKQQQQQQQQHRRLIYIRQELSDPLIQIYNFGSSEANPYFRKYSLVAKECSYTIGRTLRCDTYGKIKLAISTAGLGNLSIKVIHKGKPELRKYIKYILPREVAVMKIFRGHPNILKFMGVTHTEKEIILAMEYTEGTTLMDYITCNKYLDEMEAKRILKELVSGVNICHSLGIAIRGLKCENLVLDNKYQLKITSFEHCFVPGYDKIDIFEGTAYSAPEVVLGHSYDYLIADVWTIGIIFYVMVSGVFPFECRKLKDSTLLNYPTNVSRDVKDLIKRMLCVSPGNRITISEIRKTLKMCNHAILPYRLEETTMNDELVQLFAEKNKEGRMMLRSAATQTYYSNARPVTTQTYYGHKRASAPLQDSHKDTNPAQNSKTKTSIADEDLSMYDSIKGAATEKMFMSKSSASSKKNSVDTSTSMSDFPLATWSPFKTNGNFNTFTDDSVEKSLPPETSNDHTTQNPPPTKRTSIGTTTTHSSLYGVPATTKAFTSEYTASDRRDTTSSTVSNYPPATWKPQDRHSTSDSISGVTATKAFTSEHATSDRRLSTDTNRDYPPATWKPQSHHNTFGSFSGMVAATKAFTIKRTISDRRLSTDTNSDYPPATWKPQDLCTDSSSGGVAATAKGFTLEHTPSDRRDTTSSTVSNYPPATWKPQDRRSTCDSISGVAATTKTFIIEHTASDRKDTTTSSVNDLQDQHTTCESISGVAATTEAFTSEHATSYRRLSTDTNSDYPPATWKPQDICTTDSSNGAVTKAFPSNASSDRRDTTSSTVSNYPPATWKPQDHRRSTCDTVRGVAATKAFISKHASHDRRNTTSSTLSNYPSATWKPQDRRRSTCDTIRGVTATKAFINEHTIDKRRLSTDTNSDYPPTTWSPQDHWAADSSGSGVAATKATSDSTSFTVSDYPPATLSSRDHPTTCNSNNRVATTTSERTSSDKRMSDLPPAVCNEQDKSTTCSFINRTAVTKIKHDDIIVPIGIITTTTHSPTTQDHHTTHNSIHGSVAATKARKKSTDTSISTHPTTSGQGKSTASESPTNIGNFRSSKIPKPIKGHARASPKMATIEATAIPLISSNKDTDVQTNKKKLSSTPSK